jgi:hypothetical protein
MADPVLTACPQGVWTKVATNVTTGMIHVISLKPNKYHQTYRDTTGVAPTTLDEGVPFEGSLQISAAAGIDVYVWATGDDGNVRVDL